VALEMVLTIAGERVVVAQLEGIEERAFNLQPVWPLVVAAFQGAVARAFASEGASTGAPWAQLKRSTQRDRQRQGYPPAHPILQRSGRLMRALTIGEGAYIATLPTSMRYVLSAELGYFAAHRRGIAGRLPRRNPVLLTAADREAMVTPIRVYITPTPTVPAPPVATPAAASPAP
jgi:phage gpG-like protein